MMFAYLLIIFILVSGGHFFLTQADIDENNLKVKVAGAYNKLVRWRRNNDTDLIPAVIITHLMGGDYHLLEPYYDEIHFQSQLLWGETENEVSMSRKAVGEFYQLVAEMVASNFDNYLSRKYTCGAWINTENLFFGMDKLFNYMNDSENKDKTVYLLIKTVFKKFRTEKELEKSLVSLKKKKNITTALDDIRKLKDDYLERTWAGFPDYNCKKHLSDFKALVALENRILEYISYNDCNLKSHTNFSFEAALVVLGRALADEEIINTINHTATQQASDEYRSIKLFTNNPLALLSITTVREIISGYRTLGLCTICNCKLSHKFLQLIYSINSIKKILISSEVNECIVNLNSYMNSTHYETDYYGFLHDIQGIDDILELFSPAMYPLHQKPYIGIPYSEMPAKHGLWWVALHYLHFDTCYQFFYALFLQTEMERKSQKYIYDVDKKAFDQCGILPTTDTYDSLVMMETKRNMVYYDMIRKVNISGIGNYFHLGKSLSTPFGYESALHYYYDNFRDKELSLDPEAHQITIDIFTKSWIVLDRIMDIPYPLISQIEELDNNCGTCEFYSFIKSLREMYITAAMNYDEGRILPFPFEQEAYSAERKKVISQEALSRCPSQKDNYITLIESNKVLYSSDLMQKREAFELYLGYQFSKEAQDNTTPQILVAQLDSVLESLHARPDKDFVSKRILRNFVTRQLNETGRVLIIYVVPCRVLIRVQMLYPVEC